MQQVSFKGDGSKTLEVLIEVGGKDGQKYESTTAVGFDVKGLLCASRSDLQSARIGQTGESERQVNATTFA